MLLTQVYGLLFLLLIAGAMYQSARRHQRRDGAERKQVLRARLWFAFRLGATGLVALVLALMLPHDSAAAVWIVLWVGLYWLWKFWERRQGWGVAPANGHAATALPVPEPQALPSNVARKPLWRRVVRKTIILGSGAVVFIVVMVGVMTLCLSYYERQARKEHDKVKKGMTVDEVLPLVHGACGIRTHAVLPENVPDEESVHYVSLMQHPDGTFVWSSGPDFRSQKVTEEEAAGLMKQKMSDGYDWRWRYTFLNDTPQHFSFTVTFGSDGRVKDVTDVWGWD
jgi:preprotein translocase subunit YajC